MEPYYIIVNQCMKHLDTCTVDSIKKMRLDTHFYKLKSLLLDDRRLFFLMSKESSVYEFEKLLVNTRLLGNSPHDSDAFAALEEQVQVILAALQLPEGEA